MAATKRRRSVRFLRAAVVPVSWPCCLERRKLIASVVGGVVIWHVKTVEKWRGWEVLYPVCNCVVHMSYCPNVYFESQIDRSFHGLVVYNTMIRQKERRWLGRSYLVRAVVPTKASTVLLCNGLSTVPLPFPTYAAASHIGFTGG
jgi:hypothetical protein